MTSKCLKSFSEDKMALFGMAVTQETNMLLKSSIRWQKSFQAKLLAWSQ